MARRAAKPTEPGFFDSQDRAERRRQRRQRALFIPRLLRKLALDATYIPAPDIERAHKIAIRWADIESSGQLAQHKETSIDTQFLGEGLSYSAMLNTSPIDATIVLASTLSLMRVSIIRLQ